MHRVINSHESIGGFLLLRIPALSASARAPLLMQSPRNSCPPPTGVNLSRNANIVVNKAHSFGSWACGPSETHCLHREHKAPGIGNT
jgi:hypothetical protein